MTETPAAPLRSFAEAAEFLGMSESWLRHETAARRIPHVRFGRRVMFSDQHLAQIVARHSVEPAPSPLATVLRAQSRRQKKPA